MTHPAAIAPINFSDSMESSEQKVFRELEKKVFIPLRIAARDYERAQKKLFGLAKALFAENIELLAEAKRIYSCQGRRKKIEGHPSWGEWLEQNLPWISQSYVEKLFRQHRTDVGFVYEEPDPPSPTVGRRGSATPSTIATVQSIRDLVPKPETRRERIKRALEELAEWQGRYQKLTELTPIFKAVKELTIPTMRLAA